MSFVLTRNLNNKIFDKLSYKKRFIYLEKVLKPIIKDNKISYRIMGYNKPHMNKSERFIIIMNYSIKNQVNPDNPLIEEEVHTINTYYGTISMLHCKFDESDIKNLNLNDIIKLDDFNFNIIYNKTNRSFKHLENYTRYHDALDHSINFRDVDSVYELIDAPVPNYYTVEEQNYYGIEGKTMKDYMIESYKKPMNYHYYLIEFPLSNLRDEHTSICEMTFVINELMENLPDSETLKRDIYQLISYMKCDMENYGISKIIGMMCKKGFNISSLNTQIKMNDELTKYQITLFYENLSIRFEEMFMSLCSFLPNSYDLQLYFSLEPIKNFINLNITNLDSNSTDILQNDLHEEILNVTF